MADPDWFCDNCGVLYLHEQAADNEWICAYCGSDDFKHIMDVKSE